MQKLLSFLKEKLNKFFKFFSNLNLRVVIKKEQMAEEPALVQSFSFNYFLKKDWQRFIRYLSIKDKLIASALFLLFVVSLILFLNSFYKTLTYEVPDFGGYYKEGMVGQPRYLNPVYSVSNDIDRDISFLIFSSLVKFDKDNKLVMDLAESYKISNNNTEYIFKLRPNAQWHDGKLVTADDVVFTFNIIQNNDFQSPLRFNFQGVKVEKVDDLTVKFTLKTAYAPFITNLDVGILPKHFWQNDNISAQNLFISEFNLAPIGSGPFKFKRISKDTKGYINYIELEAFNKYYFKNEGDKNRPFLDGVKFIFYKNYDDALAALKKGKIDGAARLPATNVNELKANKFNIYRLRMPAYIAVFFNQTESKALADKNVRTALALAINKKEIIKNVIANEAFALDSPFFNNFWQGFNFEEDSQVQNEYNVEKAEKILNDNGWVLKENGFREKIIDKESVKLSVEITTVSNNELENLAKQLKAYWSRIGVDATIRVINLFELQNDVLKTRDFEALIFGEMLGADPDVFSFWHSSQKKDPGLNIAMFDNSRADKLLEEARVIFNLEERAAKYKELSQIISSEIPVIFLYSPYYIFVSTKDLRNVGVKNINNSTYRFANILNWYLEIKRKFK